jgi:hypothetical protein
MIEDVAYMRAHTVQESYMFMVDSRNRDKSAHPEPSEYSVSFNVPFRNVCSFSLLDATIPRTHYSVDTTSNTLVYSLQGHPDKFTATVPPGDYNLIQLIDTLNPLLYGGVTISPVTNPYEISNKVRISRSAGAFILYMTDSGLRTALGFSSKTFDAIDLPQYVSTTDGHLGPFKSTITLPVSPTTHVRQKFVALASGTVSTITVDSDHTAPPELTLAVTLKTMMGATVSQGTVVPSRTSKAVVHAGALELIEGEQYILTVTASASSVVYVSVGTGVGIVESSGNSGSTWTEYTDDVQLCFNVGVSNELFAVESTGLVDVTGEKLVLVRCPEVEHVMYRERYNEKGIHAGLGYVKMAALGYQEQRQDYFVPFPPRIFHPMSKLSKFTVRLENPDGTLYNTRGVDHFLLMNVTYYKVASEGAGGPPMLLNPSYSPEIHKYVAERSTERAWQVAATSLMQTGGHIG